jgi:hypothetical protein
MRKSTAKRKKLEKAEDAQHKNVHTPRLQITRARRISEERETAKAQWESRQMQQALRLEERQPRCGSTSFATAAGGKKVSRSSGLESGQMWKVQISELFSMETCDQALMGFLVATDVRKFPPK